MLWAVKCISLEGVLSRGSPTKNDSKGKTQGPEIDGEEVVNPGRSRDL